MTDLAPGTQLGGYRIDSVLGRGGMGVVYLAQQLALGRRVALKVINPDLSDDVEFRDRFSREAQLAASIDHRHIIPVHDAGEAGGRLYISMRYVRGRDLGAVLAQEGALSPERALAILGSVADALDAAHAAGLVHRDVKPANVLIEDGPGQEAERVYLTDFGLTKRVDVESGLTRAGIFVGTPDYASPEQCAGKRVDARTDVYSLACVLYECLTGDTPFPRDSGAQVMAAHLLEAPPRASTARAGLPSALDDVLLKALAKDPEQRFDTCSEMVDAARAALSAKGRTVVAPPPPMPGTPGPQTAPAGPVPAGVPTGGPAVAPAGSSTVPGPRAGPGPGSRRRWWLVAAVVAAVLVVGGVALAIALSGGSKPGPGPSVSSSGGPATTAPPTTSGPTTSVVPVGTVTPIPAAKPVACGASVPPGAGDPKPQFSAPPPLQIDKATTYTATVRTSCGTMVIELLPDTAPETVNSFVFLAEHGFFDGMYFHRLADEIDVVQGGDPTGTGSGGPGYTLPDELHGDESYRPGILAMVNTGQPHTGGSQFFIISGPQGRRLDSNNVYTVFGRIVSGLDVARTIQAVPVEGFAEGDPTADGRPAQAVYMESVTISRQPRTPSSSGPQVVTIEEYVNQVDDLLSESNSFRQQLVTAVGNASNGTPEEQKAARETVRSVIDERRSALQRVTTWRVPVEAQVTNDLLAQAFRDSIADDLDYERLVQAFIDDDQAAVDDALQALRDHRAAATDPDKDAFVRSFNTLRARVGLEPLPPDFRF